MTLAIETPSPMADATTLDTLCAVEAILDELGMLSQVAHCRKPHVHAHACCQAWSLASVAAHYFNHSSCQYVTRSEWQAFASLVRQCAQNTVII